MNKNLKKIICVDVEATCWEIKQTVLESEIIQIGISIIDTISLEIEKKPDIYVIPTTTKISQYCTDLTGITEQIIQNKGITFTEACNFLIKNYNSKVYTWAAVGEFDRKIFQTQCEKENVVYPFSQKYFNIKNIIAILNGWPNEYGLMGMLKRYGFSEFEGTHHNAGWDAWNSAKIIVKFLKQVRHGVYSNIKQH